MYMYIKQSKIAFYSKVAPCNGKGQIKSIIIVLTIEFSCVCIVPESRPRVSGIFSYLANAIL